MSKRDWTAPIEPAPLWLKAVRVLVAVALGVLLARGHDSTVLGPYHGLIALTLIVLCMPLDRVKPAAVFGWSVGLGYFGWTLRWIVEPFLVDVARHGWMAPFAIILMAGGLALFWAIAFGLARWLGSRRSAMIWLPVTLTAVELARGHVFSGFPWGLMSYTLIGGVAEVWLAWIGPYGATLLMIGFASAVVYGLARDRLKGGLVVVSLVAATLALSTLTPPAPAPTDQTVRLVQPNAPQHLKWDPEWMPVFFDRAIDLTIADDPVDVVIWPETSVPALLNFAGPWLEQMVLAARGAPVVAGIQRREGEAYHNSLVVADGPGDIAGLYDKAHLVPFGEYIPLAWLLEPIGLGVLVEQVAGFAPGAGTGLIEIDGLGLARVLICYEGIFPEEIQRGEVRPDILLIVTNDAWFGTGPGPRQHLAQAQARAIEQGLPVVRAANTGISAVINARGEVVAQLALNEAGYLDAAVPAPLPPTLYARMGDWPLLALLIVAFGTAGLMRRRFAVDAAGADG